MRRSPHVVGTVLSAVLTALVLFGTVGQGLVRAQKTTMKQKVQQSLKGTDLEGKDGPFAPIGSDLARLYHRHQSFQKSTSAGAQFQPRSSSMPVQGDAVTIDFLATSGQGATLQRQLRSLGAENLARSGRLVSGRLPIAALSAATRLDALHSAEPALRTSAVGDVTSQGDAAMNADAARSETGVNGSGVTVGVLSDSYNTSGNSTSAQDDIDSGDLPPSNRIDVLDDLSDRTDEGRAMMQIIHDVAPGADLAFHTAGGGQANFAQGIRDLANAGSGVITDDIAYFGEPWFQDGVIAEAVEDVTKNQDVVYFSAVGNDARQSHFENGFNASGKDGPNGRPLHDFGSGDTNQEVTIPTGTEATFIFQWTDPYASVSSSGNGANTDLDLYLINKNGSSTVRKSVSPNIDGDPIEIIQFNNSGSQTVDADNDGTDDTTFNLAIERADGEPLTDADDRMGYIFLGRGVTINEYQNAGPSSYGHTNAKRSHSVAAANFNNDPPTVRPYSSEGGLRIFFDDNGNRLSSPENRQVPDVTGPDGVNTTFFRPGTDPEGDGFPNFFGSSAAAPHVAGVAALMRSQNSNLSNEEVYGRLEGTALDMDDPATGSFDTGFDPRTGHGFVQAEKALRAITASVDRTFGNASSSQNYRLVALPGRVDRLIEDVVDGKAGTEWQAYRDDGSDDDFLDSYEEVGPFRFQKGNGFWLISTQDWSKTIGTPQINGPTTIPLKSGWNIISNPLAQDVNWGDVKTENGLSSPIFSFDGSFNQIDSGTFASAINGEAYYFFNKQDLNSLDIPDPSKSASKAVATARTPSMLSVSATPAGSDGPSSTVRVGLSEENEVVAPPGQFENVSLRIAASNTKSTRNNLLMAQSQPIEGNGETFDLRLTSRSGDPVTVTADNLDAVKGRSVALLSPDTGNTYDLQTDGSARIEPPEDKAATLTLAVGTDDYVESKIESVQPEAVTLSAYPNPMRRQGTLEYGLPEATDITLRVYDMLGRTVTSLADGKQSAGTHTVRFDARQLSSGVYFVRLQAGSTSRTQKITVVR